MQYVHNCIKCHEKYTDDDVDPYLCDPCKEKRKAIAEQVDRTLSLTPRKPTKSLLQEYDEAPKIQGFMILKASDL